ncbi:MAG TPA: hypothetical protein DDY27_00525 [Hyphomonadaceae bacterium]|nr:hypothetical protein [Hyphomonadaceae bacterium]
MFAFGAGGLLATLILVPGHQLHEWRALQAGVPAAFLVYGALGLNFRLGFLGKLFGDASYMLYLIHLPAFMVVGFLVEKTAGISIYANDLTLGITLVLTVVAACLLHLLFERSYQAWYKALMARFDGREKQAQQTS